jgi:hypothetical protein
VLLFRSAHSFNLRKTNSGMCLMMHMIPHQKPGR